MLSDIWYYLVLTSEAVLGIFGLRIYEEPAYALLDAPADKIEIRRYGPRLAAEVEIDERGDAGRGRAFGLLFAYIAGANRGVGGASERVAMTVPVDVARPARIAMTAPVETASQGGIVRMRFFLPARYSRDSAPAPTDPRVKIVTVAEETLAALRFSGTGRDLDRRKEDLLAALEKTHWLPTGAAYGLFYDAPFTIPFLRRNEAAVTVAPR
jgi:hypothetical protein